MKKGIRRGLLLEVFTRLFAAYGPQGWWPVTVRAGQAPVYRPGVYAVEEPEEVWEVACGAILTQNTSWANVRKALCNLTESGIRTPEAVLHLSEEELSGLIRSSGYYRQKARRLMALASFAVEVSWRKRTTERLRAELLSLNGVGPETADSILLYALGRPVFVVDAYTKRMTQRLALTEGTENYQDVKDLFEGVLPRSVPLFNEYHALIVRLCKEVCAQNPACTACPVRCACRTGR